MKNVAWVLASALFALPALGDVVHLKNGGTLEGQVTVTNDGAIIRLPVGEVRISRDAIERIEKKETVLEQYLKRAAALKEDDAEGHYQLGLWAQSVGLKPQAKDEFGKTVALKPDHEGAHQALGHRKVDGKWMTLEQEMQAKGLVQREGQWMTPEAAAKLDALKAELEAARAKGDAAEAELARAKAQEAPAANPYAAYYGTQPYVSSYYPTVPYYNTYGSSFYPAVPYRNYYGYYAPLVTPYYWVRPYPYSYSTYCWPRTSFSFGWYGGRSSGHWGGGHSGGGHSGGGHSGGGHSGGGHSGGGHSGGRR